MNETGNVTFRTIPSIYLSVVVGLSIFLGIVILIIAVIVWLFQRAPYIKASSAFFSVLHLLGELVLLIVLPLMAFSNAILCAVVPALLCLAFCLSIVSLEAKMWRLSRLIQVSVLQVVTISDLELFIAVFIFFLVDIIILIIFDCISPPQIIQMTLFSSGDTVIVDEFCSSSFGSLPWILIIWHGLWLLYGLYLAFIVGRMKLPAQFEESRRLLNAFEAITSFLFVAVMIWIMSFEISPSVVVLPLSSILMLLIISNLLTLYVPFLLSIWSDHQSGAAKAYFVVDAQHQIVPTLKPSAHAGSTRMGQNPHSSSPSPLHVMSSWSTGPTTFSSNHTHTPAPSAPPMTIVKQHSGSTPALHGGNDSRTSSEINSGDEEVSSGPVYVEQDNARFEAAKKILFDTFAPLPGHIRSKLRQVVLTSSLKVQKPDPANLNFSI